MKQSHHEGLGHATAMRGKFRGREVHILNYVMNTVFSSFPYQYKSMLNKYFFCIKKLLFLIPNQNYLGKHRLLTNLGHSIGLSVTSANPPLPLQTLTTANPPLPLQTVFCLCKPWSQQTLLCVTSSTSTTCRDLLCMTSCKPPLCDLENWLHSTS